MSGIETLSDDDGDNLAVIASLIETAKLNAVNPLAWLTETLQRLARVMIGSTASSTKRRK